MTTVPAPLVPGFHDLGFGRKSADRFGVVCRGSVGNLTPIF